MTLLIVGLRVLFAVFALVGVVLAVHVGRDATRDLVIRRAAGLNGVAELSGRIARAHAYEVAAPLHGGFLALATISAFAPIPTSVAGVLRVSATYVLFLVIQGVVIRGQARVVYWRHRVRHQPAPAQENP